MKQEYKDTFNQINVSNELEEKLLDILQNTNTNIYSQIT